MRISYRGHGGQVFDLTLSAESDTETRLLQNCLDGLQAALQQGDHYRLALMMTGDPSAAEQLAHELRRNSDG